MIIITGPGRSGTSLIALIYRELGFDPGGEWVESIEGGLEAPDVVAANELVLDGIGLTPMGAPLGARRRIRHAGKAVVPERYRARLRHTLRRLPWMGSDQPAMLRWEQFEATVDRLGPRLRALAEARPVVKDPRFFWTLPVWAAAGVQIDHVLISIRNLDATVRSRGRMDSIRFRTEAGARNSIVYGLGLTLYAAEERGIPFAVVRFPEFVERPLDLFHAARFPEPVSERQFVEVSDRVIRPNLVHDAR